MMPNWHHESNLTACLSPRAQLDAISTALAELQPKDPKPSRKIGFV